METSGVTESEVKDESAVGSRRDFFVACRTSLAVVVLGSCGNREPAQETGVPGVAVERVDVPLSESRSKEDDERQFFLENERRTAEFIPKLEPAFSELGERLKQMLRASDLSPNYQNFLTTIFHAIVSRNFDSNRNAYTFFGKNIDMVDERETFYRFALTSENFLLYAVTDGLPEGVSAGFVPTINTICIRSDFDVKKAWYLLMFFHEMVHYAVTLGERKVAVKKGGSALNAKFDFYTENGGTFDIQWETTAYAAQIDMMNVLLENELKLAVNENRKFNMDLICERLGIEENTPGLELILQLARIYYRTVDNTRYFPESFSSEFMDVIAKLYERSNGKKVVHSIPLPPDLIDEIVTLERELLRQSVMESVPVEIRTHPLAERLVEGQVYNLGEDLRRDLEGGMVPGLEHCYETYPTK